MDWVTLRGDQHNPGALPKLAQAKRQLDQRGIQVEGADRETADWFYPMLQSD